MVETMPVGSIAPNRPSPFGRVVAVEEVVREVMKDEMFYDQSGGGVTFSGGEPLGQIEFLDALLTGCKRLGLHRAVDTCGYAPFTDLERICDRVDLFLFDLKLMDPTAHQKYTGVSNDGILANLVGLFERDCPIEVRVPLIPDITDTPENLRAIRDFLMPFGSSRRISLLPYNKLGQDKIERFNLPRRRLHLDVQNSEQLERKAALFQEGGFEVRIGG